MKRTKTLRTAFWLMMVMLLTLLTTSCYQQHRRWHSPYRFSERQLDSLSFFATHHYTNNYNFVVRKDSLMLLQQLPEELISGMQTDSFSMPKGTHLVVADIRMVPTASIAAVWVQLAHASSVFGWSRESQLLPRVIARRPISEFISSSPTPTSSSSSSSRRHRCQLSVAAALPHNAISCISTISTRSIPRCLCLIVASSARFTPASRPSIPSSGKHFYFHPRSTPSPFPLPWASFSARCGLCSSWVWPPSTTCVTNCPSAMPCSIWRTGRRVCRQLHCLQHHHPVCHWLSAAHNLFLFCHPTVSQAHRHASSVANAGPSCASKDSAPTVAQ